MEFIPSIKLGQRSVDVGDTDRDSEQYRERLISLSSWMMVLGTIRAVCVFADLAGAFFNTSRLEPISWQMLGRFIEENQPFLASGSRGRWYWQSFSTGRDGPNCCSRRV